MDEIVVSGPDGSSFRFPSGTAAEVITGAMQKHYAQPAVDTKRDVALSSLSGLGKGAASLAGLPGTVTGAVQSGAQWLGDLIERQFTNESSDDQAKRYAYRKNVPLTALPTVDQVGGAVAKAGNYLVPEAFPDSKFYEPKTTAGKVAGTVAEFVPGALLGPGGAGRNLVNFAVAPGIASEAAGYLTQGSGFEPYARAGAALAAGVGASVFNQPRTVERAIRSNLAANVDDAAIARAQALMDDASRSGVNLTIAEALEQVAPGAGLTNIQRTVEATNRGREVLSPFFAERPGQVARAAGDAFDNVVPATNNPSIIGRDVGVAASGAVKEGHDILTAGTRPYFRAAESVLLNPNEMQMVKSLPGYETAKKAILADPQLARYVRGMPENSVGFLHQVKVQLGQQADNAVAPMAQQPNRQISAGYKADVDNLRGILTNASDDYAIALEAQTIARRDYLDPILKGPLGKLADKDIATQQAIEALFPKRVLPNSADEVGFAVGAVANRNEWAARQLVRAHAEQTFNDATKNLIAGENQWGGAKFASILVGDPQKRANLEAAVRALPNGDQTWTGFSKFLDIVEATGKRQAIGSKTAYNIKELETLGAGGAISETVKMAGSPKKWLSAIDDVWSKWQLGGNVEQLARILTDKNAAPLLAAIARRPTSSKEAQVIAGRLAIITQPAAHSGTQKKTAD